jgi:VWFA-related protein
MTSHRLPLLVLILCISSLTLGQTRGGGGSRGTGSYVNPATDARNAAVLLKGDNGDLSIVHLSSASDEAKVEFRSQTILIQVPVVVTDKSGNHLHGLNKEDFAILENGRPVSVTHFEELTASTTQLKSPAVPVGQFRNLALNDPQPRNIVVIALDTVNTPFLDQAYGRRELVKFLARNMESGKVLALMLITTRGLRVVQGLTGDSTHLMQALNKVAGEISPIETMSSDAQESLTGGLPAMFGQNGDIDAADPVVGRFREFVRYGDAVEAQFVQPNAIETTMNAFLGIAWSLSGVPGRKSLIWLRAVFRLRWTRLRRYLVDICQCFTNEPCLRSTRPKFRSIPSTSAVWQIPLHS